LRYQKILSQNSVLTKEVKDQIKHQKKNLLELDTDSDFDSDQTTEEVESIDVVDMEMMHFQTPH
jgi:hypothetical protein